VVILPLTASGYQIKLRVEPSQERWLTPPNSQLPKDYHDFSVIFVEVTDAQGRLVDGLPVTFRLPSDWESYASLSQPQTVTQNGVARVVLDPLTTGIIRVMTQVDDATREAVFLVQSRSGPGSGAAGAFGGGMPESRWSYDKCKRLAMQDVSLKTLFDYPEDNP
jgi:hypothetical protein